MTDTTPNSPFDQLTQEINTLKLELSSVTKRLKENEAFSLRLLQILKRGEESFALRVARAQLNLYSGLAHSLEHSIADHSAALAAQLRGFEIQVVDDVNVVENELTVLVNKTETGYDFAPANDPTAIANQATEPFVQYFEEHPEVFGDKTTLRINVLSTLPVTEVANG